MIHAPVIQVRNIKSAASNNQMNQANLNLNTKTMKVWKLSMNEYDRVVFKTIKDLISTIEVEIENGDYDMDILIEPAEMTKEDFDSLHEADI